MRDWTTDLRLLGDFNQNAIWDVPNRRRNHSRTVELLDSLGLVSAYHVHTGEAQREESAFTHLHGQTKKPFHIDYCFIPKLWTKRLSNVTVGAFADWIGPSPDRSDHVPVIVDLSLERGSTVAATNPNR